MASQLRGLDSLGGIGDTRVVLADDLSMSAIDGAHVRGWIELLLPPGLRRAPSWALLVCDGSDLVHAVVSGRGAIGLDEVSFDGPSRKSLAAIRAALGVDAVVAFETDAFDRLAARAERATSLNEHYTAQAIHWLDAFRAGRSGIWMSPPLLDLLPPLSADAIERAFNLLVPNDTALAAYVFSDDRRRIEASAIGVKRNGRIDEVSTHAAIRDQLADAAFAQRWPTKIERVGKLIGERFEEPSIAVFAERGAIRRILSGPPEQLAKELNEKTLVIDPMPRWLAGLIGGASAVGVASRGARKLGALLPRSARKAAAGVAEAAARRARESGAHPWQVLGFDPIETFRNVQLYYRD